MRYASLALLLILALAPSAQADTITTWDVNYYLRGDVSQAPLLYRDGDYLFLLGESYTVVYTAQGIRWVWQGHYGDVALPATMPPIVFPAGTNTAGAIRHEITSDPAPVAVPEPPTLLLASLGLAAVLWRYQTRISSG